MTASFWPLIWLAVLQQGEPSYGNHDHFGTTGDLTLGLRRRSRRPLSVRGRARPAVGIDIGEGLVARFDETSQSVVGLTVIGLRARTLQALAST